MDSTLHWHRIGNGDCWLGIEQYGSAERAVCIVHGFRAWHRWGFFPLVAQYFAERCSAAYVLSLPSSGYGPDGFSPERFSEATISADVHALERALDLIGKQARWVAGLGHSRGSLLLLLMHRRLDCLALWAPPRTFGRWGEHQLKLWREHGALPVGTHPESNVPLYLSRRYLDDLEEHQYNDQIRHALSECTVPNLIIAAEHDIVAPIAGAEELAMQFAKASWQLRVIPAAGHTFGTEHPTTTISPALERALAETDAWFTQCCQQNSNFASAAPPENSSR